MVSAPSAALVPLLGVDAREGGRVGWTATTLFLSDDTDTWYAVSTLPAQPTRITFVSKNAVVLESRAGVFRSESSGRDWVRSIHAVAVKPLSPVYSRSATAYVGRVTMTGLLAWRYFRLRLAGAERIGDGF